MTGRRKDDKPRKNHLSRRYKRENDKHTNTHTHSNTHRHKHTRARANTHTHTYTTIYCRYCFKTETSNLCSIFDVEHICEIHRCLLGRLYLGQKSTKLILTLIIWWSKTTQFWGHPHNSAVSVLASQENLARKGQWRAVSSPTTAGAIISGVVWLKIPALQTYTQIFLSTHPNTYTITHKHKHHTHLHLSGKLNWLVRLGNFMGLTATVKTNKQRNF